MSAVTKSCASSDGHHPETLARDVALIDESDVGEAALIGHARMPGDLVETKLRPESDAEVHRGQWLVRALAREGRSVQQASVVAAALPGVEVVAYRVVHGEPIVPQRRGAGPAPAGELGNFSQAFTSTACWSWWVQPRVARCPASLGRGGQAAYNPAKRRCVEFIADE